MRRDRPARARCAMSAPNEEREKYEALLRAAKEMVLNIQRLAEDAERMLRRSEERIREFLDESDDFGH